MKKEIVIGTPYCIEKCQQAVLKAIGKVPGVDEVSFDSRNSTVTLIGDIDITKIEKNLKKRGKKMDILTLQLYTKDKSKSKPDDQPEAKKTVENSDFNSLHIHCTGGPSCCKYCCCIGGSGNNRCAVDEETTYCIIM